MRRRRGGRGGAGRRRSAPQRRDGANGAGRAGLNVGPGHRRRPVALGSRFRSRDSKWRGRPFFQGDGSKSALASTDELYASDVLELIPRICGISAPSKRVAHAVSVLFVSAKVRCWLCFYFICRRASVGGVV